jgi:hypothetical protein
VVSAHHIDPVACSGDQDITPNDGKTTSICGTGSCARVRRLIVGCADSGLIVTPRDWHRQLVGNGTATGAMVWATAIDGRDYAAIATPVTSARVESA